MSVISGSCTKCLQKKRTKLMENLSNNSIFSSSLNLLFKTKDYFVFSSFFASSKKFSERLEFESSQIPLEYIDWNEIYLLKNFYLEKSFQKLTSICSDSSNNTVDLNIESVDCAVESDGCSKSDDDSNN